MKKTVRWLDRHTILAPHMTLCLSEDEFLRAAKHCGVEHPGTWLDVDKNMCVVHTWEKRAKLTLQVVCIHPDSQGADPIEVACSLVHEAVHVWQRLCASIGEDAPSQEFEAYSIERLSEQLMRDFSRRAQAPS